ncbi:MAG TPA: SRPBCC family protein [Xanthomonadaceae bacterium]|nr:SRPBCC family protein [Xanthomonadaceae bacterium]
MTRLIEFLISLAIVAALFLVLAMVLPSKRHLSERIETNRRLTIVYDTVNSLRRFKDWHPLLLRDPGAQLELSGPPAGVGAKLSYRSDEEGIGAGSWEIVESEPRKRVAYKIDNIDRGSDKRSEFTLQPTGRNGRNVEITQTYDVDYGWDLLGRYSGLYVSRNIGDDMKLGLSRLTNMLAAVPNFDYALSGSKMAGMKMLERPAEDLLFVSSTVDRNDDAMKSQMRSNLEWIRKVIATNGLEAAGPLRIITTEFGRESYDFDIAVPVRRRTGAAAADSDATDAAVAAPAAPAGAPMSLKLEGPVEYLQSKPGRVVTAGYTGYMLELANIRDALRAWALTQGYQVIDRPYEVYKNGIDPAFTENGVFDVYWTVK